MGWHRYKNGGGSYYRGRTKSGKYYTKKTIGSGGTVGSINSLSDLLIVVGFIIFLLYWFKDYIHF